MSFLQSLGTHCGVDIDVLRLDLGNELAPGNKAFKLAPNIEAARRLGAETLVSFGGAWSNHLHALAAVANKQGYSSVAYVRGELADTAMLNDVQRWGMTLRFLSRSDYRRRFEPDFQAALVADIRRPYLIPEGGANALGASGCADILGLVPAGREYDQVYVACGTGTTLAGLIGAYTGRGELVGVPVLRGESFLASDIDRALAELGGRSCRWRLDHRFHCGGYAKVPSDLLHFIREFEERFAILLDPIYTGKLFRAIWTMLIQGELAEGRRILVIHTGGLQGRRGFPELFSR